MWVKCISRLYLSSIQPTTRDKISWDYFPWSAPLKICKLQRGNIAFLPPRCTVVLLFELPVKKHLRPQLWMEGRIVDCFVLQIYLRWGQCLNNFVTNWRLIQKLLCFFFPYCREKENSGSTWGQITFNIRYTILQLL